MGIPTTIVGENRAENQRRLPRGLENGGPQAVQEESHFGMASRRQRLRIVFAYINLTDVRRCVRELNRAHFNFTADIAMTRRQLANRLKSGAYDVVIAELGDEAGDKTRPLDMLSQIEK